MSLLIACQPDIELVKTDEAQGEGWHLQHYLATEFEYQRRDGKDRCDKPRLLCVHASATDSLQTPRGPDETQEHQKTGDLDRCPKIAIARPTVA